MTDSEKIYKMECFLKLSFCIDGECKSIGFVKTTDGNSLLGFELTDSKRGLFRVYLST